MSVELNIVNPLCEKIVGNVFDEQVSSSILVRQGLYERETWKCRGQSGNYYVKLFRPSDPTLTPEATFYGAYSSRLDCVVDAVTLTDLAEDPFVGAIAMREAAGTSLDTLLQQANSHEARRRLSALGGNVIKKLHSLTVGGFGLLTPAGAEYPTWSAYISAMAKERRQERKKLVSVGLTNRTVSRVIDVLEQSKDINMQGVLCHGDPKPSHVFVDHSGVGRLIDFGIAQANIPIRDCLQYGNRDRIYFDESTLLTTITQGSKSDILCSRAEALVRLTRKLSYAQARQDQRHVEIIDFVVRQVLDRDDLPKTSMAEFFQYDQ